MVDYRINLAKTITSTPEMRQKFYHRMILYLVLCSAGLVYTAYLASANVVEAYMAGHERRSIITAVSASSDFSKSFYKDPANARKELELYAEDLALLKGALAQRTHFLPALNQLFIDFPDEVAVEDLEASAGQNVIKFSLLGPVKSVKEQQDVWSRNEKLKELIYSVKQVSGEQTLVGNQWINSAKFECVLK